jgi:two-component system, LuxR family, sensor kinase FixL
MSEEELGALLLDAAADAVIVIDEQGRVEAFNVAAEKLFGYRAAEVVGNDVAMLMPEPHRSQHKRHLRRYLRTGEPRVIGIGREIEARDAAGRIFPVSISVGEHAEGKHRRFIGILRDLSAKRSAEQSTRSVEARLTHVGRFNLLGEMAAGIAHEINQPLSAIATYAQASLRLMQREPADLEALTASCKKIAEQAGRAGQVIENLRRLIRKQEVRPESLDVNEVIANVMNLVLADAHAGGIDVATRYAEDLPTVTGDRMQLQQALLNLTRNAVDAMNDSIQKHKGITIATAREGDDVLITVTDHGHGIPARLADSIFHPFVTTKRDGLGVGLAISRTIVQSYGGSLSCMDNPEGGSIFMIRLPSEAQGSVR